MSVNEKMTAIADKLRAMLGTADSLSLDGMASALDTQAAQVTASFSAVAEKGGTVPVSQLASTLPDAIRTIPSGVEVQTASGSVTTTTSGKATLNIGFKPDLLVLKVGVVSGYEYNLNLALTEKWTTSKAGCVSWYGDEHTYEAFVDSVGTTRTSLYVYGYNSSWDSGPAQRVTFQWKAVKYTA